MLFWEQNKNLSRWLKDANYVYAKCRNQKIPAHTQPTDKRWSERGREGEQRWVIRHSNSIRFIDILFDVFCKRETSIIAIPNKLCRLLAVVFVAMVLFGSLEWRWNWNWNRKSKINLNHVFFLLSESLIFNHYPNLCCLFINVLHRLPSQFFAYVQIVEKHTSMTTYTRIRICISKCVWAKDTFKMEWNGLEYPEGEQEHGTKNLNIFDSFCFRVRWSISGSCAFNRILLSERMFNIRQFNQIFVNWLFWLPWRVVCQKKNKRKREKKPLTMNSLSRHLVRALSLWLCRIWLAEKRTHSILGNRLDRGDCTQNFSHESENKKTDELNETKINK